MRKAHVLVHNIEGVATETIKNIVLSGIGTLTIVDGKNVAEEDLSSGFFYREEDIGKRVSLRLSFRFRESAFIDTP
jgi:ubiquitin-like 1-activating enzyme E1 A